MKKLYSIFIAIAALVCFVPLLGMLFTDSKSETENRRLTSLPSFAEEGKFNIRFLPMLGAYYEDHFALRQEIVAANSAVMSKVFAVSPVDTIIKGKGEWLYYKDSLSDYRRDNVMSDREAFCLAHNLGIVKNRLEKEGISFVFTIAPNKNSLYGENMPYYFRHRAHKDGNIQVLTPYLKSEKIIYADLFRTFSDYDGVLYRKQDSHWNGEGALLAYRAVMDATGFDYNSHDKAVRKTVRTESGDLAKSLYGKYAKAEWDVFPDVAASYRFVNEAGDWEALTVETESSFGQKTLLMYRDSFGNTLSPFLADAFAKGFFSKATVYHLERNITENSPDCVIFEIVERNLTNYIALSEDENIESGPPIMYAPEAEIKPSDQTKGRSEFTCVQSDLEPNLGVIYGTVSGISDPNATVFVEVNYGEKSAYHEAFLTSDLNGNDYGFVAYMPWSDLQKIDLSLHVLVKCDGEVYTTETEDVK